MMSIHARGNSIYGDEERVKNHNMWKFQAISGDIWRKIAR
jgi:hypothetical protein